MCYDSSTMPVSCCAVNCANRFQKGSGIGFYVFPMDSERKQRWVRAISRDRWEPKLTDRLCGEHFVSGRPSKNPEDIDYMPTVFKDRKRRSGTLAVDEERQNRRAKGVRLCEEQEQIEEAAESLIALSSSSCVAGMNQSPGQCVPTVSETAVQTDSIVLLPEEVDLKVVNQHLQQKVVELERTLLVVKPDRRWVSDITTNDGKIRFYTGLPSCAVFRSLLEYMQPKVEEVHRKTELGRKMKLTYAEQFLAMLMRLCLGLLTVDVAHRFEVSPATISRLFTTWITILAAEMKVIFPWPSKQRIQAWTPSSFKKYRNTRIIIDCTEFFIQRPSSLQGQSLTFSYYKHYNTFKALIGISPGGVITFVSELWGGRISDKAITEKSGVLDLLEPGDNVMADRGFDIGDVLEARGITLNIPPFLGERDQLSSREVEETRRIASLRIHVERAIGRMKNYRILHSPFPINLADLSSDIICVCAYLTNFTEPVVPRD